MDRIESPMQVLRRFSKLALPSILKDPQNIVWKEEKEGKFSQDLSVQEQFPCLTGQNPLCACMASHHTLVEPLRIGVLFSGGPAPGGHNVIAGLYDALHSLHPDSVLIGFLEGPSGLLTGSHKIIDLACVNKYRNSGGFDLLASGRSKIETEEQLQSALMQMQKLSLQGLIVIGGDDSNTNAAFLAEYCKKKDPSLSIIGIPKTIDGDLKNSYVSIPFGFDTACKVYAEIAGNIAKDALSARKYYHFIRLMGRTASHIVLEVGLQTQPNDLFISEEVGAKKQTLKEIVERLADLVCERFALGKSFGVILLPEGLIESIAEIGTLISELNQLLAKEAELTLETIFKALSLPSRVLLSQFPQEIQSQLLLHRDPHGNVQVSAIESEKLLTQLVKQELIQREKTTHKKIPFSCVHHFLGYEARSAFPSYFDSHYTYALGYVAALLVRAKKTGYMAALRNLHLPVSEWSLGAVPLTSLMHMEMRKGKKKAVIRKSLVEMNDPAFLLLNKRREDWRLNDHYLSPGPMQFETNRDIVEIFPLTLRIDQA